MEIFVECLSVRCMLAIIFRGFCYPGRKPAPVVLRYAGMTSAAGCLLPVFENVFGVKSCYWDFCVTGTLDLSGKHAWLQVHEDQNRFTESVLSSSGIRRFLEKLPKGNRFEFFLRKELTFLGSLKKDVFRVLKVHFMVRVVESQRTKDQPAVLFIDGALFSTLIAEFAAQKGVVLAVMDRQRFHVPVGVAAYVFLQRLARIAYHVDMSVKYWLRSLRGGILSQDLRKKKLHVKPFEKAGIAVDFQGSLNLQDPCSFSDLFFCQAGAVRFDDVMLCCNNPVALLNDAWIEELSQRSVRALALTPRAAGTPFAEIYTATGGGSCDKVSFGIPVRKQEDRWLWGSWQEYARRRAYWVDLIKTQRVGLHVTWAKQMIEHSAVMDAIDETGGVSAVYQRSFEHMSTPWVASAPDIFFGFSRLGAHQGFDRVSRIPYYVVTGYLGDFRFELLKEQARLLRQKLHAAGVKKVMALFDENYVEHPHYDIGIKGARETYTFLIRQVLANPWFGLIVKPKIPSTLHARLGPVGEELRRAQATGRCVVVETKDFHSACPPALAAMAADVAVHDSFGAATAGVEAALTGVRTAYLDFGEVDNPALRALRDRQVVFQSPLMLWEACLKHWDKDEKDSAFGDWGDVLHDVDPFRDGRAAERMGDYLNSILQGLRDGLARDKVLSLTAERYRRTWGDDKILSLSGERHQ